MGDWKPNTGTRFVRRCGRSPKDLLVSTSGANCPDIFEMENGDFVVIGADVTDLLEDPLPTDAGVANGEAMVMVPRATMLSAFEGMLERQA